MTTGVSTFLTILFILYILNAIYKAILITVSDYPRTYDYSIGEDVLGLLVSIGMAIIVGIFIL